jgi:allantoin racemase
MRTIGLINPNTTQSMTEAMAAAAREVACGGTDIVALTAPAGPAAIESYADEVYAANQVVSVVREHPGLDGYVIACSGDPGLLAAREVAVAPVVGIGEAAFLYATTLAPRFAVLTTLDRAVEQVWRELAGYGLTARCCAVRACGVGVLESGDAGQLGALAAAGQDAVAAGGEALVLGCGGMSDIADRLAAALGVPVVDGVRAATTLCEGLIRCQLATSKSRTYAAPVPVEYLMPAAGA